MRAVFVNHCHPDMAHVCALRQRKFAEAMAARGHQIVLLTEALENQTNDVPVSELSRKLKEHNWARPFFLPVSPLADPTLFKLRHGQLEKWQRQSVILMRYLLEDGLYGDWRKATRPYLGPLATRFKPDVIWASFGNTGVWNIAQDLAKEAHCPWVADIKDNWQNFIPKGLRRLIAARYQSATHMTTFSEGQSAEADLWFHQQKTVIYSSFDNDPKHSQESDGTVFEILLSGSIYREERLEEFITGLEIWLKRRSGTSARPVRFSYAGNDHKRVAVAAQKLERVCSLDISGFLPIEKLIRRQNRADLNAYIRVPGAFIFHHKLFELLDADKPVLVYPEEVPESIAIATDVSGTLHSCESPEDVAKALGQSETSVHRPVDREKLARYSWQGQVEILEKVLDNARRQS